MDSLLCLLFERMVYVGDFEEIFFQDILEETKLA
jgi:hypothetical protein